MRAPLLRRNPSLAQGWPALLAGVAILASLAALSWQMAGGLAWDGRTLLGLSLFGSVCVLAGVALAALRLRDPLQQARTHRTALQELSPDHLWMTDAEQRLQTWLPPTQTDPLAEAPRHRPPVPLGTPLALPLVLEAGTPAGDALDLSSRLSRPLPVPALRVLWPDADGQPQVWRLQARPLFDASGRFQGHLGSLSPLDAQAQRRAAQRLLQTLWPQMDEAVLRLAAPPGPAPDTAAVQVTEANPAAMRLLADEGSAPPALPVPLQAFQARVPEAVVQAAAALAPGGQLRQGDWQLRACALDDGSGEHLLLLQQRSGGVTGADAAAQSDQDAFVYTVSHDLRAPIRVVEGFARILKEDYGRFLDRIGNDHLDRVLAAAARMNSMIDALLALSRLQSQPLARKPVDLSQLAGFILDDLRREAPGRAAEFQIEPDLSVQGDPTLLRVALENLLGNAWKYSGQTSRTRIGFHAEQQDGRRVFVVSDNGAGFDMRFADRLFGVFQRLHSPKEFQGTGVGLASVRRIIRRHGGDIWADAAPGQGARFFFTLGD